MCGIFGGLSFSGEAFAEDLATSMSQAVARRGPDDQGLFQKGAVMLGHRRLSIIDLSENGHQPMTNVAGGYTIVFNGTIYNYPELRDQLIVKGYRFRSHSDTEVILNAYMHWGEACVERLHGMFAFAIWDEQKQTLFLARDRMGIKPLYYAHTAKGFFFASNMQALMQVDAVDTSLDSASLHHLFTLHAVVPAPGTLFQGIQKCPPAHWMRLDAKGNSSRQRYWHLSARRPEQPLSDREWREQVHHSLL